MQAEKEEENLTHFLQHSEPRGIEGSETNCPTKRHVKEDNPVFVHVQPPGSHRPPPSPMDSPLAGTAAEGGLRLMLLVTE